MRLENLQKCSAAALRVSADEWDDLWQRSASASPLDRASHVAYWSDQFSNGDLQAIEVRTDGRLVAALPLVEHRRSPGLKIGGLPSNAWSSCGTLLLDASVDPTLVVDGLTEAIDNLPWPLVQLFPVPADSAGWQDLRDACYRRGLTVIDETADFVGVVEIRGDWSAYRSHWSTNHRRHVDKANRRARRAGRLQLDVHTDFTSSDIEHWLRLGFEIEDRSWKGAAGSSVLRTPSMFDFFHQQALQLAAAQQLQLTFLKHNDRPIAFEYGYRAKGTYFSHKVGYDSAFANFSPGQLLRALLLEHFHNDNSISSVDFRGPLTDATSKWSTRTYRIAKWLIAPRRVVSRLALNGYRAVSSIRRRLRAK